LAQDARNKEYWQLVLSKFKTGDRNSFEEIYNEFSDQLFAYGAKITSDRELLKDCIQDLFIDLYKYNPSIKNPELLEFYLYKSLKRLIIKKRKNSQNVSSMELKPYPAVFDAEMTRMPGIREHYKLVACLFRLPMQRRRRFIASSPFLTGYNYMQQNITAI